VIFSIKIFKKKSVKIIASINISLAVSFRRVLAYDVENMLQQLQRRSFSWE